MQRNSLLEAIADPSKNFLAFLLIGIFGLGIISSGISNLLLETLGSWLQKTFGLNKVVFQLGVIGLIGLAILLTVYFTNLTRKLRAIFHQEEIQITNVTELRETYFGLITVASYSQPGKQTPAEISVRHHWKHGNGKLRYCWLVCTPDALPSARALLSTIQQECRQQNTQFYLYENTPQAMPPITQVGTSLHIRLVMLESSRKDDPNYMRQLVDSLYESASSQTGLSAVDLIADYTGGTKSMTAGVVLACSAPDRNLEYIVSDRDPRGNIISAQLMKVILSYKLKAVRA